MSGQISNAVRFYDDLLRMNRKQCRALRWKLFKLRVAQFLRLIFPNDLNYDNE